MTNWRKRSRSVSMIVATPPAQRASRRTPFSSALALNSEATSAIISPGEHGHAINFEMAGFDFGEVENVIHQGHQVDGAAMDRAEVFVAFFLVNLAALQQHLGESENSVERSANLVAHVGQESTLGPIGGDGRFFGGHHGLLGV